MSAKITWENWGPDGNDGVLPCGDFELDSVDVQELAAEIAGLVREQMEERTEDLKRGWCSWLVGAEESTTQ